MERTFRGWRIHRESNPKPSDPKSLNSQFALFRVHSVSTLQSRLLIETYSKFPLLVRTAEIPVRFLPKLVPLGARSCHYLQPQRNEVTRRIGGFRWLVVGL